MPKKANPKALNVYVALLRGVNVGGNNMISMSALKESFTALGFAQVTTYINSGNIMFSCPVALMRASSSLSSGRTAR